MIKLKGKAFKIGESVFAISGNYFQLWKKWQKPGYLTYNEKETESYKKKEAK
ncbi:unnamed protein product [marine sediment metagenome]|uniref:Uncharacterized protein n=1 Tax=marine sediment metagenome TaxID=412755 RepID=X1FUJ9_9ZZZZ